MRRWVCIVTLLAGFTREPGTRDARAPRPIPIERPVAARDGRMLRTPDWWRA
jgi:hypothetical protein